MPIIAALAERIDCFSEFAFMTSVTHSELIADKPESSVELKPESSMMEKRRVAQVGRRVATVWTPIIELSTFSGKVIARSGLTAISPSTERAIGTIPKRMPPRMNAFLRSRSLIAKERCQYCWSQIAPAISPIEVTMPKEKATEGSKMLLT